nr:reverse transcriptase domain-containing protein [Tanacetum cinerariifolium]
VDLTGDEDPTNEDGDTGMGDLTRFLVSLGGDIFSGEKKSQESNIGGSDNTGDRGPNMVPNSKKLMEVFIEGLPRSIEGNVTASKPQTLEEAINIAQRLMDQKTKHNCNISEFQ